MIATQKIATHLWFDSNAEEAIDFYTSIFPRSKVTGIARYTDAGPGPAGSVMSMIFELAGQEFMAVNGGPYFKFSEAISLVVKCDSQDEIDSLWDKLVVGGGAPQHCGWLKDRYGLSWQIVPAIFFDMMQDKDLARTTRVMTAILKMIKLDIDGIKRAYDGA